MSKKTICIITAALMLLSIVPAFAQADRKADGASTRNETVVASWDFETDPIADGWQFVDADGDGKFWEHSGTFAHSGSKSIRSYSYLSGRYYDPDNWAISPAVTIPNGNSALTFWGRNRSATGTDIFRVYAGNSPEPEAMSPISSSMAFSGTSFEMISVDISALAGQTVHFAFRHANSYDGYILFIDDVSVVTGVEPTEPGPDNLLYGCYFEDDDEVEDWLMIDADGDGSTWKRYNKPSISYNGVGHAGSQSVIQGIGSVMPDNWFVSPPIRLPSDELSVSFYAKGHDPFEDFFYEHFTVYAATSPELDDLAQVEIIPETTTQNSYICYTADLSDFANQTVYIAIRHHNCTGQNILLVDSFEVWGRGDYLEPEPTAPTVVYGDANLNGEVEVADSLLLMRYLVGSEELNDEQLAISEVDCADGVNIKDALLIMRYALGSISVFPIQLA